VGTIAIVSSPVFFFSLSFNKNALPEMIHSRDIGCFTVGPCSPGKDQGETFIMQPVEPLLNLKGANVFEHVEYLFVCTVFSIILITCLNVIQSNSTAD
jgi:hypothetical protein